jgi:hypothetical protein
MKRKIKVVPGTWIFVPLQNDKGVLGIITVHNPQGVAFGYFFGDVISLEDILSVPKYKLEDAIYIAIFSDMGLRDGTWKQLDMISSNRDYDFSLPKFEQKAPIPENGSIVTFAHDLLNPIDIRDILPSEVGKYPSAGLGGSVYVEEILKRKLNL